MTLGLSREVGAAGSRSMPGSPTTTINSPEEVGRLRRENDELVTENRRLELQVRALKQQLWGSKSERHVGADAGQAQLFQAPATPAAVVPPTSSAGVDPRVAVSRARAPMGPKPLDPKLPREVIAVPAPDLTALICPETKRPMQAGFVESLEVLARRPAVFFVKRYERTVFVSPAKTAPVYAPWPADILPRARMHASVVAYVAAAHFCEHQPYHRIEQHLARTGVDLPRNSQVSLMRQLDELVRPLVAAMKAEVLGSDYLQLDATPVPVCDPSRPGATREATLWAYRSGDGTVWFDYQPTKSPQQPDQVLKGAKFRGRLQTDGASGLGSIGPPGQVIALGCHAHLRRYFFQAWQAGEKPAEPYLSGINRLFRIERLAQHFRLSPDNRQKLRARHSVPAFDALVARAQGEGVTTRPKSLLGEALHYLLAQREPLRRCLTESGVELSNNGVERAIRPLKLGAKNWLQIGHPAAGPRLAHLFTLVENCRLLGLDPEAYLIELIAHLPAHPVARVAEWLPRAWRERRNQVAASTTAAAGSR